MPGWTAISVDNTLLEDANLAGNCYFYNRTFDAANGEHISNDDAEGVADGDFWVHCANPAMVHERGGHLDFQGGGNELCDAGWSVGYPHLEEYYAFDLDMTAEECRTKVETEVGPQKWTAWVMDNWHLEHLDSAGRCYYYVDTFDSEVAEHVVADDDYLDGDFWVYCRRVGGGGGGGGDAGGSDGGISNDSMAAVSGLDTALPAAGVSGVAVFGIVVAVMAGAFVLGMFYQKYYRGSGSNSSGGSGSSGGGGGITIVGASNRDAMNYTNPTYAFDIDTGEAIDASESTLTLQMHSAAAAAGGTNGFGGGNGGARLGSSSGAGGGLDINVVQYSRPGGIASVSNTLESSIV